MTCGLYPKKDRKSFASYFLPNTANVPFGAGGTLTEIQYVGFGFVHTRRVVYERIRNHMKLGECNQRFGNTVIPYFLPEVIPDGNGRWYLPEDYAFCHRARTSGIKIVADTTIRLSHVGKYPFTWEDLQLEQVKSKPLDLPVTQPPCPTPDDLDE
jgi:hypothetical protein